MKALKHITTLLILTITFFACNSERDKLAKVIEATEASANKENIESASALAKLYEEFATRFKEDDKAPVYLIEASKLYVSIGNYNKSIELYDYVMERYPDSKLAADALFSKGFVYENNLNDISRAKATYEEFLEKYPEHYMAADVRKNMPTIGKDVMPDWVKDIDKLEDSTQN